MRVEVTLPERVLWPDPGTTKQQLVDYYQEVGSLMLPWVRNRLLTLKRAPSGVDSEIFFQKNAPKYTPEWIKTQLVPAPSAKRDVRYLVCNNRDTLAWIANQAGVELHVCLDRIDKPGRPDLVVFDLDPVEGGFAEAVEGAFIVRDFLVSVGIEPLVKTTGGKGVHVCFPLARRYSFKQVHDFALDVGAAVVREHPELLTLEFKKDERGGRVLIDVHRNGPGATIVAPFSPRARPGAPVSFPVTWDELSSVSPDDFTVVSHELESAAVSEWKQGLKQRARLPRAYLG